MLLRIEIKRQQEELERRLQKFEEQKEKLLAKARQEAREIVQETKELSDLILSELRELEKYEDKSLRTRKKEALRREIRELQEKNSEKLPVKRNFKPVRPEELNIGDRVKLLSLNQNGELISLPDDKNEVQVQVGLMKINVGLDQISKVQNGKKQETTKKSQYGKLYRSKVTSVAPSCNVVGKVLDDALVEVDKYLDDAFMAGLKEVTIIHGRGTGILRGTGICSRHINMWKNKKGNYNEGGDSVVIVT